MGIDRIGKSGAPAPLPEAGGPSPSGAAGAVFHAPKVGGTSTVAAGQVDAAAPPAEPLARLRAGEVDLDGYLNLKVDEATAHLTALPPAQLDAIRGALRERLASDPSLVELIHTATGQTPNVQDD
jgi:hypothetical protein